MSRRTVHTATSSAGFTLVEALIALVLVGLALLIATSLLLEAQRALLAQSAQGTDAAADLVIALLQADVGAATGASAGGARAAGASRPLRLRQSDGSEIVYRLDEDRLVRTVHASGAPEEERVLLAGVRRWVWRPMTPSLLQIELETIESPRRSGVARSVQIWRRNRERSRW